MPVQSDIHNYTANDLVPLSSTNTDVTLDVSATQHGFAPKGDGSTTKFLNANGAYSTPVGSGGTVTTVSVVTTNGFAGTVANPTTTPAITLTTTITGVLKGNGTAISAAVSGTDYAEVGANTSITSLLLNQTGLAVKGATANALTFKPNETLTAGRTLNFIVNDVDRTINLSGNLTVSAAATISGSNTGDQTTITGNAGSATVLQTARTINGVSFDGSANITVTAAAGTLTGTVLNASIVTSSLTSVGTLTDLTVTNTIVGSINGNAATVTTNANLTGPITSVGNATTVAANVITNAMLAQVTAPVFKGRTTAGLGNVEDLTAAQATALLDVFTSTLKGLVPASGGGSTTFLRADGVFAAVTAVASISQTEVDFGPVPVASGTFVITDAAVSASSRILAQVAYIAPTGKDLDEIEMDDLQIRCAPGAGQLTMFITAADKSYLADTFTIFYQVGA